MKGNPANWVFLGDSLTEGIGVRRDNYVSELATLLRDGKPRRPVHDLRLREVDPATFNKHLRVNLAAYFDRDPHDDGDALWLWNLASEGRFIDDDLRWLPFVRNLGPRQVFVYRGSLESIVRPAAWHNGRWPAWVPAAWRGLVTMDPRCYFSRGPIRRFKQTTVDALKQSVRLRLLAADAGRPLYEADLIERHYQALVAGLASTGATIHLLGLIPPDDRTFPGSARQFHEINERLRALAASSGVNFIDWAAEIEKRSVVSWRCRDGFHPNAAGARLLATVLHDRVNLRVTQ